MNAERDVEALVRVLREDREHGASELARRALSGVAAHAGHAPAANAAELRAALTEIGQRLQVARPSMAPVANLLGAWLQGLRDLGEQDLESLRARAVGLAQELIRLSLDAVRAAAEHAAALVGPGRTVITHSLSSTVLATFERLAPRVGVIVTESRPPGEGRPLAERLADLGIRTQFISDAQIGLFAGRAQVALVGADTVTREGAVVNKAGTYLLALAARAQGLPLYVCFESFKRAPLRAAEVELEAHDPIEIDPPRLAGVEAYNIYFDITPASLVTAWVTEHGVERAVLQP